MATKQELKDRATRIREIDELITKLFKEHEQLMYDGLTNEEHNRLHDLVHSDGKSHWG